MEIWVDNSIWIAILLSIGCWPITKFTWRESLTFFLRLPVSAIATLLIMYSAALFASLILHLVAMPPLVIRALGDAPADLIFYFFESGAETALFWIPIMVIQLTRLSYISSRKRN